MTKFDEKFKIPVVEQYLSGTDGWAIVGRRNGVSVTMVKQWSYQETALAFGIRSEGCLAVAQRCYHSGGIDALKPRKRGRPPRMPDAPTTPPPTSVNDETRSREDLLAEINQLRMENAYLKS